MVGQYLLDAIAVVFTWQGALALILSVGLGLVFGMLPGLTATMGVALLTGLTYSMDGPLAVLTLIGVYIGAISGGCQAAILLNIPGTPGNMADENLRRALILGNGDITPFFTRPISIFFLLFILCLVLPQIPPVARLGRKIKARLFPKKEKAKA